MMLQDMPWERLTINGETTGGVIDDGIGTTGETILARDESVFAINCIRAGPQIDMILLRAIPVGLAFRAVVLVAEVFAQRGDVDDGAFAEIGVVRCGRE